MKSELIFKYGTMASGKSLYLLSTAHQFKINNIKYQLFKSDIDTRDIGVISSRIGISEECILINKEDYFEKYINSDTKWILIDEAQFLTISQINQLRRIVNDYGISVSCYGLSTDFLSNLFPPSNIIKNQLFFIQLFPYLFNPLFIFNYQIFISHILPIYLYIFQLSIYPKMDLYYNTVYKSFQLFRYRINS